MVKKQEEKNMIKLGSLHLEQFRDFLDQQEAKLANSLMLSTLPAPGYMDTIHLHGSGHFRLNQALQAITSRVKDLREEQTVPGEWQNGVAIANQALWSFCEVLESAVIELVQLVQTAGIAGWNNQFFQVALGFKELIAHRLEDAIWLYRRLEELFFSYRATCKKRKNLWVLFGKLWSPFSSILDKQILNRLFKAEEALSTRFKGFSVAFDAYREYEAKAIEAEERFRHYPSFNALEAEQQILYLQLYKMLRIWEENSKQELLNPQEILTAVKGLVKPGVLALLFKDYLKVMKEALFQASADWQDIGDRTIKVKAENLQKELHSLGATITTYREMLLRSDPNPYVRTRWGVSEWAVGPEPRRTRELMQLIYDVEMVHRWSEHLIAAIAKPIGGQKLLKRLALKRDMDEVLHEMGQPLSSRHMLHLKGEQLVALIESADELGGSNGEMHSALTDVFLIALRLDSKYQVLFDFPKFEELFAIHEGFMPKIFDPQHDARMKLFKQSLHHIEHWLKESALQRHEKELEVDEGAIQEALQGLLASLQRGDLPAGSDRNAYYQMLMEYRYLFNKFFHSLRRYEGEGKMIRTQFKFVDNYLESAERQLRSETDLGAVKG